MTSAAHKYVALYAPSLLSVRTVIREQPRFEISTVHGYEIDGDKLSMDVDCAEFGRAFKVEWCAVDESMELVPDGKGGRGHWTGFGADGEPDGCEQSKEECPLNEAMELLSWLRRSDDVASTRARLLDAALTTYDPS